MTDLTAIRPKAANIVDRIRALVVGEAPVDADEVVAHIRVLPDYVRIPIISGIALGLWILLFLGARALLDA